MFPPRTGHKVTPRPWRAMRAKVDEEGQCRSCGVSSGLATAHVIPRSRIGAKADGPLNCVPLCDARQGCGCHEAYDRGEIDLEPFLAPEEMANAVLITGSLSAAARYINGRMAA